MSVKKRFIAGAICPKCNKLDSILLCITDDDEHIQCVHCDYYEEKPIQKQPEKKPSESAVTWYQSSSKET